MKISKVQKWLTLIGFCLCSYANAIPYGLFSCYLSAFAQYYYVSELFFSSTYYIGLILQIILCLPVMKILLWRMDYAILAGAFLNVAGIWIMYFIQRQFYLCKSAKYQDIGSLIIISIGTCFFLPTGLYIAQRWFKLENRAIVIGLSFYSNLLGYGTGAILCFFYMNNEISRISIMYLATGCFATLIFLISLLTVSNKPKTPVQQDSKNDKIACSDIKVLWKYKYNTYAVIMASVFLGVSWTFLQQLYLIIPVISYQVGVFITIWLVSGSVFGLIMSALVNKWVNKTGNYRYYDWISKTILMIGILGYTSLGICWHFGYYSFPIYIILMIVVGVGSLGYYGLIILSLVETMYPLSPLLIGTIMSVVASIYSGLTTSLINLTTINPFFIMAFMGLLPFCYMSMMYLTKFKRYKYYLNEKSCKYELLSIDYGKENQVD